MTSPPQRPVARTAAAEPAGSTAGDQGRAQTAPPPESQRPSHPRAAPRAGGLTALFGRPPRKPLLFGLTGTLLVLVGSVGGAGVLIRDPLLSDGPLGFWRYGHGRWLAIGLTYLGLALLTWAWVMLGRAVLAREVGGRGVLVTAAAWLAPIVLAAPLFTRDVYSYLAQGAVQLAGQDPYAVGPEVINGPIRDNVHEFWQATPANYGPLFILVARGVAALTGENLIAGVIGMRLVLLIGLVLLVAATPGLVRYLGGRVPTALWITIANPMTVIHLVGGPHNDLLLVGLLAVGALLVLNSRHVAGIAAVSLAMAVKATAGLALPFLVLVWAGRRPGSLRVRILTAGAAGIAVFGLVFGTVSIAAGYGLGWLPALSAPANIVNWLSLPTAIGEFMHWLVDLVAEPIKDPFITVARVLGWLALLVIAVRQWLLARDGGPDAVRRAGLVLVAAAVLAPTTLPWYVTWGMVLLAAGPWIPRGLAGIVFASVALVTVSYPDGESALYTPLYLALCAAGAALAAVSLRRPDPLGLRGAKHGAPA